MIPAHKQTDPNKKPGQIVNKIQTLGDYVAQVYNEEEVVKKKLTFNEWFSTLYLDNFRMDWVSVKELLQQSWKAAQENK